MSRAVRSATIVLVLGAILLVALAFRAVNLVHWDSRQGLHPDERFVQYTVVFSRLPRSAYEYFDSSISPLNPRNHTEWSGQFFYGTLPISLTRAAAELLDRTTPEAIVVVGRALSVFFDLLACLALFALGRLCYGRSVGMLAAALYAVAVMPIQQSHFFTTDNFGVAFTTLTLVAAVRLSLFGRWHDAVWAGLWTGAAAASKINLLTVFAVVGPALVQFAFRDPRPPWVRFPIEPPRPGAGRFVKAGALLLTAGLSTIICFRIFQPDAFAGTRLWDLRLEQRFLHDMRMVRGLVNGSVDMPPSHQWAGRKVYLFPWWNMVAWGLGLPLGLAAWSAFASVGVSLVRHAVRLRTSRLLQPFLLPWLWVALYFAWQGAGFNPSMRYFLPIYPPLILFAAWGCLELGRRLHQSLFRGWRGSARFRRRLFVAALPAALVLGTTATWAWAFTRIYTRPHTRVEAGRWMLENAPRGSSLTWELWDDPLPYTNGGSGCDPFCLITTTPYAEDEPAKFFGKATAASPPSGPGAQQPDGLINQLARADYVVLSSARVYESVRRLPHRYPATLRYYRALFDGSLGFDLVGDFHSFPTLFGVEIPDLGAEEAFTVYDHPRVLIFRRSVRFDVARARDLLTAGVVWDEIYRISARTTSEAPDALRMQASAWQRLQSSGEQLLARAGGGKAGTLAWIILWLAAVELLGLAGLGVLCWARVPLPDHGILSARLCGLILFGLPPGLVAASGRASATRPLLGLWFAVVAAAGLGALWSRRDDMRAFVRRHWRPFWFTQALVVAGYTVAMAVRAVAPMPADGSTFGYAHWAALLRSPVLPPPDPLFAGGELLLPYAALVPVVNVARLLDLPPALSFNLALATMLALLVSLVWVATSSPLHAAGRRPPARHLGRRSLPWLAVPLLLAPGLPVPELGTLTPVGTLAAGNLPALAGLAAAAGALALARATILPPVGGRALIAWKGPGLALLLTAACLGLVGGTDRLAFWALLLPVVLLLWKRRKGGVWRHTRAAAASALLVACALLIARSFTATGYMLAAPEALLSTLSAVLGLGLAISGVVVCFVVAARRIDPLLLAAALLLVVLSFAAGAALGWPFVLPLITLAGALAWLIFGLAVRGRGAGEAGIAITTVLVGCLLIAPADLIRAGYVTGEPQFIFGIALLLLVWGSARAAAFLVRRAQATQSLAFVFAAGLLLGMFLMGTARTARAAAQGADAAVTPGLQEAIDAIARDARGAPVVAVAPTSVVPALVEATGLPVLLATPEAGALLRSALRPSYDAVLSGRARALADIYGPDPASVHERLRTYAVEYVLVGPDEYALYGPEAGAGLRLLAEDGTLQQIYAGEGAAVYRHTPTSGVPPYVAQPVDLPVPALQRPREQ